MAKITIVFNAISLGTHNLNLKGVGSDEKKFKKTIQRNFKELHQQFTIYSPKISHISLILPGFGQGR